MNYLIGLFHFNFENSSLVLVFFMHSLIIRLIFLRYPLSRGVNKQFLIPIHIIQDIAVDLEMTQKKSGFHQEKSVVKSIHR